MNHINKLGLASVHQTSGQPSVSADNFILMQQIYTLQIMILGGYLCGFF